MPGSSRGGDPIPPEMLQHYEVSEEAGRLGAGPGRLEEERTRVLVRRYLPPPPAVVLDVGGGPGAYACWLAGMGYEVHLVDPVPLHVEQASDASRRQPTHPIASVTLGDARALDRPNATVHAVLMFGPLYHLTSRGDRLKALREARRVLVGGGVLMAVGISRFASLLDGLARGFLEDPSFASIVERDLAEGQHRNPTGDPRYFTTAFFHRPEELKGEIARAGLRLEALIAIEGPAWLLQDLDDRLDDVVRRQRLLDSIRVVEAEASVLGASAHIMAMARKRA